MADGQPTTTNPSDVKDRIVAALEAMESVGDALRNSLDAYAAEARALADALSILNSGHPDCEARPGTVSALGGMLIDRVADLIDTMKDAQERLRDAGQLHPTTGAQA